MNIYLVDAERCDDVNTLETLKEARDHDRIFIFTQINKIPPKWFNSQLATQLDRGVILDTVTCSDRSEIPIEMAIRMGYIVGSADPSKVLEIIIISNDVDTLENANKFLLDKDNVACIQTYKTIRSHYEPGIRYASGAAEASYAPGE